MASVACGPATVLRRCAVAHELPEGDTVVFDEAGSELLVLNHTGAGIWYLIDGRRTLQEVADIVQRTSLDAPSDVREAVITFAKSLMARRALKPFDAL